MQISKYQLISALNNARKRMRAEAGHEPIILVIWMALVIRIADVEPKTCDHVRNDLQNDTKP